jgi:tetratricopeptide (TPR) repeat protein
MTQVSVRMDKAFSQYENSQEWNDLWKNEWYDKYDSQIGEARFMSNNKDWMGVINFISDIIKNDSRHHELLYYRARAFYEMDNFNTAVNDYCKAIEINKHHYEYFEGRADAYLKLKKEKDAVSDLSTAINLAPDEFGLYLKRSETYLLSGNYNPAKSDVDFYLSFFDNDTTANYLSGRISLALGNYLEALSHFNYLINNYPQTARYYLSRGETFEKTSMLSNALKDYIRCLNIEPDNIIALKKRGQLLLNKGDRKAACQDFKKAMNLGDFQSNNLYLENCR